MEDDHWQLGDETAGARQNGREFEQRLKSVGRGTTKLMIEYFEQSIILGVLLVEILSVLAFLGGSDLRFSHLHISNHTGLDDGYRALIRVASFRNGICAGI
jgi:hypothetical protein